ncbi:MAG: hypothetical protein FJ108_15740 [Deltaproteobacteria bacterium]|nr:hypothetical protein [Deltaproteobacteria bacterium]
MQRAFDAAVQLSRQGRELGRRSQPSARLLDDPAIVVGVAEEEPIDQRLRVVAKRQHQADADHAEDDREDRLAIVERVGERAMRERDAAPVDESGQERERRVRDRAADQRVDLEQVVTQNRVGHRGREQERGERHRVLRGVQAHERRDDDQPDRGAERRDRSERDHADALARLERRRAQTRVDLRRDQADHRQAEQEHRDAVVDHVALGVVQADLSRHRDRQRQPVRHVDQPGEPLHQPR